MQAILLVLLLGLSGCGSIQKMAMRSTTPMFQKSTDLLTTERSWSFFAEAAPGNLKMMELLSLQDQDNTKLLAVLVKGYAGYAFAVPETLAFEDEILGRENPANKKEAIIAYTKALDYGLIYFARKDISIDKILKSDEHQLLKLLDKEMDEDDFVAVLYTAQAWGSLINLQRDNVALVAQVPKVKAIFDWVCKKSPDIENNVCGIFYAQYEAARPKMLGGNPELARELYKKAIAAHPQHHLIRMNYIQFLLLPSFDEENYETEATVLRREFVKWEDLNRDDLVDKSEYRKGQHLNLFNAIAKKRFEIVEANKKKIF